MNRRWLLAQRPADKIRVTDFAMAVEPMPTPAPGEALVRNVAISVDPANRAWLKGRTYRAQVRPGDLMPGFAIGVVEQSTAPALPVGTVVEGGLGWQEFAAVTPAQVRVRPAHLPIDHLVGVLGLTGLTAYFGLVEVGRPRPGETVVVSAAAGAVGSVAAQVARLAGCRVVGIAGGAAKRRWLEGELGLDAAIDHRGADLDGALRAACPQGVDLYFDNVGGAVLEAVLGRMNIFGRVACCGAVSGYDTAAAATGPAGVPQLLVTRRLRMEGFIFSDFETRRAPAEEALQRWLADGLLKSYVHWTDGFEQVPQALVDMLAGGNIGKAAVRL
jgi:NADPH-dependent curcumin reductase CurA